MRCAALLAALASRGMRVDRAGTGLVVEVYPAASLWRWQLPYCGYKGPAHASTRHRLVEALQRRAPWLHLAGHEQSCRDDDDALDAVLAAITAQSANLNLVTVPSPDQGPEKTRGGKTRLADHRLNERIAAESDDPKGYVLRAA